MLRRSSRYLCLLTLLGLLACGNQGFAAVTVREGSPVPEPTVTSGRGAANPTPAARGGTTPTPGRPEQQPTPPRQSRATATRVRTATPGTQNPLGTIPQGWKIYRGTAESPFAIAYPPDWQLDDSQANVGRIVFTSAGESEVAIVDTVGDVPPGISPSVLRDRWFESWADRLCTQTADEETGTAQAAGLTFATVGGLCDANGTSLYLYTGIAQRDGAGWGFVFLSRAPRFQDNARLYFAPMLGSLNIYDNP